MKNHNKSPVIAAVLIPRIGEVLFIAIFIALIGLGPKLMNVDGDLGRHITLGDYIISSRSIPTKDVFSHTKLGDPLTPHEWLAEVIFSLAHRAAGLDGIVWITALIIGYTFWLVYKQSLNLSSMSLLALAGAILAAAASSLHWLSRPHIFTVLFTIIWTTELEKLHIGSRKNWVVFPVIMLVWVNTHGAFIAGILIWACYFVGLLIDQKFSWQGVKPYLWIGLSSLIVSLINPDGLGIWKTGFGFLGNRYLVSHTAEYLPPDFHQISTWPFLLLIVLSIGVLAISNKKMNGSHVLLLSGWTAMSLYSARNIPLYAVIVVPILVTVGADYLQRNKDKGASEKFIALQSRLMDIEKSLKSGFWSGIVVVAVGLMLMRGYTLDFQNEGNQFLDDVFPVQAVDWIEKNQLPGEGFNYFPWGGYLLYRTWPEKLVFIDGQTDFYGEELTRKYEKVITVSPGWEDVLLEYQVRWVLMPTQSELIQHLQKLGDWDKVYQDQFTTIMLLGPGE